MADHNENLKDTLNEEIEHADQKPAEEHYSLNDDRRVKVLSPGMLVTKRFFRNRLAVTGMAILVFMFVFSFIGGLISPYEQDKFFYADKTIRRSSRIRSSAILRRTIPCSACLLRRRLCWPSNSRRTALPTVTTDSP